MTNIRRYYMPNTPVFITTVCYRRKQLLKSDVDRELLLSVMREIKSSKPFSMIAYVILDDHFHWIIKPSNTHNFSQIMQSVKLRFVHRFKKHRGIEANLSLWQRRFWDHVIRNRKDLNRHIDYVHYNPVKHGYVARPFDYEWSSFKTHVDIGNYQPDWAGIKEPDGLSGMDLE